MDCASEAEEPLAVLSVAALTTVFSIDSSLSVGAAQKKVVFSPLFTTVLLSEISAL